MITSVHWLGSFTAIVKTTVGFEVVDEFEQFFENGFFASGIQTHHAVVCGSCCQCHLFLVLT